VIVTVKSWGLGRMTMTSEKNSGMKINPTQPTGREISPTGLELKFLIYCPTFK